MSQDTEPVDGADPVKRGAELAAILTTGFPWVRRSGSWPRIRVLEDSELPPPHRCTWGEDVWEAMSRADHLLEVDLDDGGRRVLAYTLRPDGGLDYTWLRYQLLYPGTAEEGCLIDGAEVWRSLSSAAGIAAMITRFPDSGESSSGTPP